MVWSLYHLEYLDVNHRGYVTVSNVSLVLVLDQSRYFLIAAGLAG